MLQVNKKGFNLLPRDAIFCTFSNHHMSLKALTKPYGCYEAPAQKFSRAALKMVQASCNTVILYIDLFWGRRHGGSTPLVTIVHGLYKLTYSWGAPHCRKIVGI